MQQDSGSQSVETRTHNTSGRVTLAKGTVLQQRYQVTHVVGLGGMSTVYAARDLRFAAAYKPCAVKEMSVNPQAGQDREQMVQTFEREANLLASLNHPAIPKVYDFFPQGGQLYLVLEFIHGNDLETVLNASAEFLPQEAVLSYALQIVDVLAYLHHHKPTPIVFRDLKPSNVMFTEDDRIVLIDFGIAKVFQASARGTMIGTEGYCPPEQYRGMSEPRGDLYSLGALMHHMLTRSDPRLEPPFTFHERPPTKMNPAVSKQVEDLILRAVAYDPDDRFASAEDMRNALERCLDRPRVGTRLMTAAFTGNLNDAQSRLLWRFTAEDEIRSTPLVANGMAYIGVYDENLYALQADNGNLRWKFSTEGGICSTATAADDMVIFGSEDKMVYAIDVEQRSIRWMFTTNDRVRSSPRVDADTCYIGSDDGYLYAIDIVYGHERWKYRTWRPLRCTPCVSGNLVYAGSEDCYVYAVEKATGNLKWKYQTLRAITSSPIEVDGFVLIGSMDNHLYCFDAQMGWLVWRFKTDHFIVGSPRVGHGMVFVGSTDQNVYAIDLKSGRMVWKYQTSGQISSTPVLHGDMLFVTGIDQHLYCINARSGKLVWRFRADGMIPGSPVVYERTVYFGATDCSLYAVTID